MMFRSSRHIHRIQVLSGVPLCKKNIAFPQNRLRTEMKTPLSINICDWEALVFFFPFSISGLK
jgi:hypothetical protein